MALILTVDSGRVYCGISAGKGVFHDADSPSYAYLAGAGSAFSVLKDRITESLSVTVTSEKLQWFLRRALPLSTNEPGGSCLYDLHTLLSNYAALKSLLHKEETNLDGLCGNASEIRLFVRDFLADISIWKSFGLESLHELGILSAFHWQDMQHLSSERDLDDLEDMLYPKSEDRNQETDINIPSNPNVSYQQLDRQLRDAARNGRYNDVHAYLADHVGPVDASCLTAALHGGHLDIFWLIFDYGAAVTGDMRRWMAEPIYTAASRGYLDVVRSLVQRAKTRNALELAELCFTPLNGAAGGGHIEVVRYFISLGANINRYKWNSPLYSAIKGGHLAVVQYLAEMGAELNSKALIIAVKGDHLQIAEYLLKLGVDPNSYQYPPLLTTTILENNIRMFYLLLRHGVDVNYGGIFDDNAIFAAVKGNHVNIARSLLQHGVAVYQYQRPSLLRIAVSKHNPELSRIVYQIQVIEDPFIKRHKMPIIYDDRRLDCQSEEPMRCPIVAEIKAKERWVMKQRLRKSFLRSHNQFLEKSSKPHASNSLATFASELSISQSVWKKGITSIRRLLNNRLPSTLKEVFGCVQLSCAMRYALDGIEPQNTICEQSTFSADLDRWRLVVPAGEQPLYDEIASIVWGKSYQNSSTNSDWRYEQEILEYFQKLMTSLISEAHASFVVGENFEPGGHRLRTIQDQFAIPNHISDENDVMKSHSMKQCLREHNNVHGGQPPILDKWKPASPMVILLTATAVFMIVIAFLTGTYRVLTSPCLEVC